MRTNHRLVTELEALNRIVDAYLDAAVRLGFDDKAHFLSGTQDEIRQLWAKLMEVEQQPGWDWNASANEAHASELMSIGSRVNEWAQGEADFLR
jgi:hypothetical protein